METKIHFQSAIAGGKEECSDQSSGRTDPNTKKDKWNKGAGKKKGNGQKIGFTPAIGKKTSYLSFSATYGCVE